MKIITEPRTDIEFPDDLDSFGKLIKMEALVYENDEEGMRSLQAYNMDGDVAFYATREAADAAFDIAVAAMKACEQQFIEEQEEEAVVALFETPKGLMILAATSIMGFDTKLEGTDHTHYYGAMPHVTWERILYDIFGEESE